MFKSKIFHKNIKGLILLKELNLGISWRNFGFSTERTGQILDLIQLDLILNSPRASTNLRLCQGLICTSRSFSNTSIPVNLLESGLWEK